MSSQLDETIFQPLAEELGLVIHENENQKSVNIPENENQETVDIPENQNQESVNPENENQESVNIPESANIPENQNQETINIPEGHQETVNIPESENQETETIAEPKNEEVSVDDLEALCNDHMDIMVSQYEKLKAHVRKVQVSETKKRIASESQTQEKLQKLIELGTQYQNAVKYAQDISESIVSLVNSK